MFSKVGPGFKDEVAQLKKDKSIEKRPRNSVRVGVADFAFVARLEEKVDNLEYMVELVYKMLRSKELGVSIDEVEASSRPREAREAREAEVEEESDTKSKEEDIPPLLVFDPQSASMSDTVERVEDISEYIT